MMKHFKLLLTVALVALIGAWTFATIEVQTTTPKVNPDGTSELVGQMRLIFSAPEFTQIPPDGDTAFAVIVRVQLTLNKRLMTVGGQVAAGFVPIPLVWERDTGNAPVESFTEVNSARILGFYSGDTGTGANSYVDLLFLDDQGGATPWPINNSDRVRVTIGAPAFNTNNTEDPLQGNTQMCVDFTPAPDEFAPPEDMWKVGMDCHVGTDFNIGAPYPVNFQPASPYLAQKGSPTASCRIYAWWPGKSDNCKATTELTYAQNAPTAMYCSNPGQTPPCSDGEATWWLDFCWDDVEASRGHHWYAIREDQCPAGRWLFYPGGRLTITLDPNELDPVYDWNPGIDYCNDSTYSYRVVVIYQAGSTYTRTELSLADFTIMSPDTWEITLPTNIYGTSTHPAGPVCMAIRMPPIAYNFCPLLDRLETDCVPFTVDISFSNTAGCSSGTVLNNWQVGKACGCQVAPMSYDIPLYFPFIPPVNMTGIACYAAITNYADQALDDGEIDFWTDQGSGFIWKPNWSAPTPLGGHQQWILNMGDAAFKANVKPVSSSQADKNFGARNMSAIAYMQATDPNYPFGYLGYENGSLAGVDAFVWIVLGDTAQGYLARHLDFEMNFYGGPGTQWVKPGEGQLRNGKTRN